MITISVDSLESWFESLQQRLTFSDFLLSDLSFTSLIEPARYDRLHYSNLYLLSREKRYAHCYTLLNLNVEEWNPLFLESC